QRRGGLGRGVARTCPIEADIMSVHTKIHCVENDPLTAGLGIACACEGCSKRRDEYPPLLRLADDLQVALRKWEDARQRRHKAQVAGDVTGAAEGLEDEFDAMGDAWECRQVIADTFCLMLRLGVELYPAFVREILAEVFVKFLADELPAAIRAVSKGAR